MNRPLLLSSLLFLVICSALFYFLTKIEEADEVKYQTLLNMSRSSSEHSPFGVKQERKGVHKQILMNKLGQRQEVRLQAPRSYITLNGSDLIEKFEDVSCAMQEKLYVNDDQKAMQEIKELQSKHASLSYQDHLFQGENVQLSHFVCEGKSLGSQYKSPTLIMKGKAESVHFSLDEELKFQAHRLKASFYPSEK